MTTRSDSLFDPLVEYYDAARPSYPDELFAALAERTQPLAGARIVEVGAGTGIATRGLRSRGAVVLPVDHGPAMLARLQQHAAAFPTAVQADAHHIPVRSGWADLVCYAQAWHWTDMPVAAAEAARILRPGGALAVWWNLVQSGGIDWLDRQHARIAAANPSWSPNDRTDRDWAAEFERLGWTVAAASTSPWLRTMAIEDYLLWMRSKSYVAAIGEPGLNAFIAAERDSLLQAFPDGRVAEPFATHLFIAHPVALPDTGADHGGD